MAHERKILLLRPKISGNRTLYDQKYEFRSPQTNSCITGEYLSFDLR